MEDLEQKFSEAQQLLVDRFKEKLRVAASEMISTLYTDLSNWATTDAHMNYHNFLREEFRESMKKEITSEYGHYSWAHTMRMEILKNHKEELQNKIIIDLQHKVESLEKHIEEMRDRRHSM